MRIALASLPVDAHNSQPGREHQVIAPFQYNICVIHREKGRYHVQ